MFCCCLAERLLGQFKESMFCDFNIMKMIIILGNVLWLESMSHINIKKLVHLVTLLTLGPNRDPCGRKMEILPTTPTASPFKSCKWYLLTLHVQFTSLAFSYPLPHPSPEWKTLTFLGWRCSQLITLSCKTCMFCMFYDFNITKIVIILGNMLWLKCLSHI